MRTTLIMATLASLTAGGAMAALLPQLSQPAAMPVVEASVDALAEQIVGAVSAARESVGASSTEAAELEVSAAVEAVIGESGASPETVLAALKIVMAREQCVTLENGRYDKLGCGALAAILSAVGTAIGGPAALGGTGNLPTNAAGPPPSASGGSDYSN